MGHPVSTDFYLLSTDFFIAVVMVCLAGTKSQSSQVDRPETRGHDLDLSLNLITNPELLETRSSSSHGPGIGSSIMILIQ